MTNIKETLTFKLFTKNDNEKTSLNGCLFCFNTFEFLNNYSCFDVFEIEKTHQTNKCIQTHQTDNV
jgi:hypothetical protein